MLVDLKEAAEQAVRLDRTIGYQRGYDKESQDWRERLVGGLINACHRHSVSPAKIIDRCLELSQHCPTDYDLFKVGESLRELETWKPKTSTSCPKCSDTGWEQVFVLHTREGDGHHAYVKKERITREVYDSLNGKLDPNTQQVFSGAKRCDHKADEPEWTAEQRRAHGAKWAAFLAEPRNSKLASGLVGILRKHGAA